MSWVIKPAAALRRFSSAFALYAVVVTVKSMSVGWQVACCVRRSEFQQHIVVVASRGLLEGANGAETVFFVEVNGAVIGRLRP